MQLRAEDVSDITRQSIFQVQGAEAHHYAVKAFEVHALDYLTKPVEEERLALTISHVKERIASRRNGLAEVTLRNMLEALGRR
jgi:DNA-binding LytR/AlgR family response regulator